MEDLAFSSSLKGRLRHTERLWIYVYNIDYILQIFKAFPPNIDLMFLRSDQKSEFPTQQLFWNQKRIIARREIELKC